MQLFALGGSKFKFYETFFDIIATHDDHPSYVQHVLGDICVFFTRFGYLVCWGGCPNGLLHSVPIQFVTLYSSKIEDS